MLIFDKTIKYYIIYKNFTGFIYPCIINTSVKSENIFKTSNIPIHPENSPVPIQALAHILFQGLSHHRLYF